MMKVCILSNDAPAAFQSSINAFIADKKGHRHQISEHDVALEVYKRCSFGVNYCRSCTYHL